MRRLRSLESKLLAAEKAALVAFLAVMVLISFCQVVLRQFFGKGLLWGDTLSRHMVLWAGFLGAAIAAAENKHFAWEALAVSLKGRTRSALNAVAAAACLVITILLARASWFVFTDDRTSGAVLFSVGRLHFPSWGYSIVYPAGFALISLHLLLQAAFAAAGQDEQPPSEAPPAATEEAPAP